MAAADGPARAPFPPQSIEFFESKVRPLLVEKCLKCHGEKKQSGGLRLDSREWALKGGDTGPAVLVARPDESLLVQAVAHTHAELKMPPSGKLAEPAIAALRQWVSMGAPWPAETAKHTGPATAAKHWAFEPIRRPATPAVRDRAWPKSPVDDFVLARLEASGLTPSAPADRRTLIRRATLDLWGIPPTAAEVDAFIADRAPDAYERLVDRLLASPRYGERWARHWLDVARYADTKGYVFTQDRRYPYAYTYRDYVIQAFNTDLGFDQFVIHQLAADQVVDPKAADTRALAAMGFLTVGRRFLLDQNEINDDRIDVVTRGFLGLTVTCARCHDHKFDPIPSADYYSLYGVFASSVEPAELPRISGSTDRSATPQGKDFAAKLAEAIKARDDYLASLRTQTENDLKDRLSLYLAAARDLGFNSGNGKLVERALAAKLNANRLRLLTDIWNNLRAQPTLADHPVLGIWRSLAEVPPAEFATRAAALRDEISRTGSPRAARVHPLVIRDVLGTKPPSSQDELISRYIALLGQLEAKWNSRKPPTDKLVEPEWESLRMAFRGPGGPLTIPIEIARNYIDQGEFNRLAELEGAITALSASHPGSPPRAMVMNDAPQPYNPYVFIRGNPGRPGPAVPRQFVGVVAGPNRRPFQKGSGRLELAQAIADRSNPLTPRVLVNRVWSWHFGKGLVNTPSDFGVRTDQPSHPELLDYLSAELIDSGWSIKTLQRTILLSNTYQQRSDLRKPESERDPENRLVWRFNRQRLDFESMRDSMLAVSGALDPAIGGPAVNITEPPFPGRRTLYGFIDRQNLDGLYRTFDFAVPDATSPRRFVTTVPQQALFMMNSPFLHEQARRLAAEIHPPATSASPAEIAQAAARMYRQVLGRSPVPREEALAGSFIVRQSGAGTIAWKGASPGDPSQLSDWEQLAQVLLLTNEFMFVD
jgi:hypothetical protein